MNTFIETGYLVHREIFSPDELERVKTAAQDDRKRPHIIWPKDLAVCSRHIFDFATQPKLLEQVQELLGDEVQLWGAFSYIRPPGAVHHWHTDIESSSIEGGFLTAWIALDGASRETSLKLVPGSHHFDIPIQQVMKEHNQAREEVTDTMVKSWANSYNHVPVEIDQPDINNGGVIFFDGRLWHGSANMTESTVRAALLLQFVRSDVHVPFPDFRNLAWPFSYDTSIRPPCLQVLGNGTGTPNYVVDPPPNIDNHLELIETEAHSVNPDLVMPEGRVFTSHFCFNGRTANTLQMRCHYSKLLPGAAAHPPHGHVDEEILILIKGDATFRFANESGLIESHPAHAGDGVYYPSFHQHTIHNTGAEPILYLMFKWVGGDRHSQEHMPLQRFRIDPIECGGLTDAGYSANKRVRGATHHLKILQIHITTLQPGAGYDAHSDKHDVAIIIFEGHVETNGHSLGPGQFIWHPAGIDHDMWNHRENPSRYLVIEFHGSNHEH